MSAESTIDQQISALIDRKDEQGIIAILTEVGANGDYVLTSHPTGQKFPLLFAGGEREDPQPQEAIGNTLHIES